MEAIMIRGREVILPVCVVTSTVAQGATLASRWLHELQPTINQPGGLRYRPPVLSVSTRGIPIFVIGLQEAPRRGSQLKWQFYPAPRGSVLPYDVRQGESLFHIAGEGTLERQGSR